MTTMGDRDLAQLRQDAAYLRQRIAERRSNTKTHRPFTARELAIMESMLAEDEAEIKRREKEPANKKHKEQST